MPFVRFSRDKRGYEHLYLVDTGRDRGRSRVLYWFRTPPGVRVGRNPFDVDTQKALERQNPDVHFDWAQIVASKIPPPVPVENWREKRRVERAIKRARAEDTEAPLDPNPSTEEPFGDTVEVSEVDDRSGEEHEAVSSLPSSENLSMGDQGSSMEPTLPAASTTPGSDSSSPAPAGRRRRRRRGRRRPRPEIGANSPPGTGGLDPPTPDMESSNEE